MELAILYLLNMAAVPASFSLFCSSSRTSGCTWPEHRWALLQEVNETCSDVSTVPQLWKHVMFFGAQSLLRCSALSTFWFLTRGWLSLLCLTLFIHLVSNITFAYWSLLVCFDSIHSLVMALHQSLQLLESILRNDTLWCMSYTPQGVPTLLLVSTRSSWAPVINNNPWKVLIKKHFCCGSTCLQSHYSVGRREYCKVSLVYIAKLCLKIQRRRRIRKRRRRKRRTQRRWRRKEGKKERKRKQRKKERQAMSRFLRNDDWWFYPYIYDTMPTLL